MEQNARIDVVTGRLVAEFGGSSIIETTAKDQCTNAPSSLISARYRRVASREHVRDELP